MNTAFTLENTVWSNSKKIGFRFFFSYFILFIFFNNNGAYPFFSYIEGLYNNVLYEFIPWVGKVVFGITETIRVGPNGSGDTTYDYLLMFTIAIVSVMAAIVWSLFDRNSKHYIKMYYWLTLSLRLYVGLMLISYGMVKVIQLQFSSPSMYRLTQAYGESSPMGLAWTFLGFSKGYNLFMGIAEVAAVLLLFRRTLTFGLIITLMTTANVMAVNYFYDVPVRILSTHLVIMSAFLLARDFNKLCQFFFLKKAIILTSLQKPKFKKGFTTFLAVSKIVLLSYSLGYGAYSTLQSKEMYRGEGSKSILAGFYEIKELTVNNEKIEQTLKSDISGWKHLMIDGKRYAQIQLSNHKSSWYKIEVDSIAEKLKLTRDTLRVYDLKYRIGEGTDFYLDGTAGRDTISIKLKRTKDYNEKFLLTNRGFHWINEVPYNR
ncbi:MAG: hypothetical protein JKY02_01745 [Flavobacteriaceae bacterium]|nr:hypothetical protein [Flavobacteriaceae bacterium]